MSNKQTMSDVREIAESTPRLKGYVVACVSWLRGGSRGTRWMLDARIPLKEVLELMPVPMLTIDHRNRITFANAETMKLFGYTWEELAGASVGMLFPIHALYDNHLTAEDHNVENRTSDASRTQVVVAQRRDGFGLQTKISVTKYMGSNQILQITAISDRSAWVEVDRSREDLEHLARVSSLGELAGSLAHELKQPLTAILFNAQAAQKF